MSVEPYVVFVEGNIAAGKSSFVEYVSKTMGGLIQCYQEPIEQWSNFRGHDLLDKMYQDPINKSFLLQVFIQHTMAEVHLKKCDAKIKLNERSLLSERYVFINMLQNKHFISHAEYDVLDYAFQSFNRLIIPVNEIIYLRTTPSIAMERLLQRKRHEERNVTLEYLEELHKLHEEWLMDRTCEDDDLDNVLITVIDQDKPLTELRPIYDGIITRLLCVSNEL